MAVEVFMPKMSDHMEVGEIIRWLVGEGDQVEKGQVIMEVLTDKVVADLEAPASGIMKGIRAGAVDGAIVPVGLTFAFIAELDEEVPVLPPLAPALAEASDRADAPARAGGGEEAATPPASSPQQPPAPRAAAGPGVAGRARSTPVARRVAKELGVDLALVPGTGPEGRIREEDVRAFAKSQKAKPPEVAGAVRASPVARRVARELSIELSQVKGSGPGGRIKEEDVRAFAESLATVPSAAPSGQDVDWLDLNPIQRLTGQRMLESVQNAPQFALTANADATNLLWLREALMERMVAETGERLSITAMLVKVVASALRQHPRANASFEDGRVKLHPQVNVGVAMGTEDGLVVPAIKDADQKSLGQITRELKAFQGKAQQKRFTQEDLAGGTFTISNLGMYGVDSFTAIINPPESAILAVGRTVKMPVGMPDDTIALRPIMALTLTIDHRSMDGVQGAKFLTEIREGIEEPYFLL